MNESSESNEPPISGRRNFLKQLGILTGSALLPDISVPVTSAAPPPAPFVITPEISQNFLAQLRECAPYLEDGGMQVHWVRGIVEEMKRVPAADAEAVFQRGMDALQDYEAYLTRSTQSLLRFDELSKAIPVEAQKTILASSEGRAVLKGKLSHMQRLRPDLVSDQMIDKLASNSMSHYQRMLEKGPSLVGQDFVEHSARYVADASTAGRQNLIDAHQVVLNRELRRAEQKNMRGAQHRSESLFGSQTYRAIESVKLRVVKDGYILRLQPVTKHESRAASAAAHDAMAQNILAAFDPLESICARKGGSRASSSLNVGKARTRPTSWTILRWLKATSKATTAPCKKGRFWHPFFLPIAAYVKPPSSSAPTAWPVTPPVPPPDVPPARGRGSS